MLVKITLEDVTVARLGMGTLMKSVKIVITQKKHAESAGTENTFRRRRNERVNESEVS